MNRVSLIVALILVVGCARLGFAQDANPKQKQPNILFAIADDASWQHFSAYGCKFLKTPNFDRVAREGALFTNCFTPLPKCSPSRAAILTGKNPWQLEEAADHYGIFPAKFKVFPDLLEASGYFVGYTGKGWGPGNWKKGGFQRNPAGAQFATEKLKPPTTGINALDYAANFAEFLKARPKDKPFYFWYGGFEPHRPYERGSGLKSGKKLEDVIVPPYLPDDEIVRNDLLDYALEIEWFDNHLGRIIKQIEDAGELDNTLIVVTSDNGMSFPRVKGAIYEDACHMPLAIRWPKTIKPGRVIDDFVSFIDFAPTFLEAAGATSPDPMTGRSLMTLLKAENSGQIDPQRDHVILGREREDLGRPNNEGYPVRGVRTRDFLYTRNFKPDRWPSGNPETHYTDIDDSPSKADVIKLKDEGKPEYWNLSMAKRGTEELYDLKSDPECVKNVAGDAKYATVKEQLWENLESALREQQDPRILGNGDVFEKYENTNPNRNRTWDTYLKEKKD